MLLNYWVGEDSCESLGLQIKPANHKENQSWIFTGKTDAVPKTPRLRPPDAKNWLLRKDPCAWKIEGRKRREWQRMRRLDGIPNSMDMSLASSMIWWCIGRTGLLQSTMLQRVRHNWVTEWYWTEVCQAPLSVGILQARIVKWVAMPLSRGFSQRSNQDFLHCRQILYQLSYQRSP